MIVDGERIKTLLKSSQREVLLCSPFIKAGVLRTLFSVVPNMVKMRIVTRWRPSEVAAGVSDLEVFEIANERRNTELLLLDELHAKLYKADDRILVGSANLTATALGWANRNNLELLIEVKHHHPDVVRLLARLETAIPADFAKRSQVQKAADLLEFPRLDEGEEIIDNNFQGEHIWLPRCAAPEKLFAIYANERTSSVVEGTRDDGMADLRDLQLPSRLSEQEFMVAVKTTLEVMPSFVTVLDHLPKGVTDTQGHQMIAGIRSDYSNEEVRDQWRMVRDWISVFFREDFETAPQEFITRPRSN